LEDNIFENGTYTVSPAIAYEDSVGFLDWRDDFVKFLVAKKTQTGFLVNPEHSISIN
jgi:hypothetical protein